MKRITLLLTAVVLSLFEVNAAERTYVSKVDSVITNARFMPTRQRINRNIDKNKFVYKGEYMLGLTASYGNLNSSESDIMLLLDNINLKLQSTSIKPFFAYSYRDNQAVGLRFGYEKIGANVGNLDLNLGLIADMENMGIANLGLCNKNFMWSLFHRNYIGLDRRGIVGVILEGELMFKSGSTAIWSGTGENLTRSDSRNFAARLNFNPGIGVYVFPQVCLTVTVGTGGLFYNNIRQYDLSGGVTGRRDRTGMQFKLNIADIQIGLVAHLWNSKK
ncbi:MAG: hypothetical protein IKV60_04475 [Rikenellaceae bacterium]|nr:hypothetical protein [Rikenellaceae bacterium]